MPAVGDWNWVSLEKGEDSGLGAAEGVAEGLRKPGRGTGCSGEPVVPGLWPPHCPGKVGWSWLQAEALISASAAEEDCFFGFGNGRALQSCLWPGTRGL